MNIILNHKIIKEICGAVSFKRGNYFYRENKVVLEQELPNLCVATVTGEEDFHVTIEADAKGSIRTQCSCPKLASFKKDCQHVAAVLIAINENSGSNLTTDVLNLFTNQKPRSSGHQLHFEQRTPLNVEFTCKPFEFGGGFIMGIEMNSLSNIRTFLEHVREGIPIGSYNPNRHCFLKETDDVIRQLIKTVQDEKVLGSTSNTENILPIPSSAWERLFPLLQEVPLVKLEYGGQTYMGMHPTTEPLPLEFEFKGEETVQLHIKGFERIVILDSYQSVLIEGKIKKLESHDFERLAELKQMLKASGTNQVPIPKQQIHFFLEKAAQGLKRLGTVTIADNLKNLMMRTPLKAKLYLDRVKNRLLAGLEFHYEHIIINPLEKSGLPTGSLLIRDIAKEDQILQIMDDCEFSKTEEGYFLHNEELEYEFLVHVMPKLQKLVQIYATTAVRNRIFRGEFRPQIRVKVKKERTNWLEFKFTMDGINELQIKEVLSALEEKRKYYRLPNGSLLSLQTREFEEIQRYLKTPFAKKNDLANGLDLPFEKCLELLDMLEDSDVFVQEDSFRQFLAQLQNPGSLKFAVPPSLESVLKDYQKLGFSWMKTLAHFGFGGILADDMGLGKTIQSISYIVSVLPETRKEKRPVLVLCPSSLTYNWLNEIKKFAPELHAVVIDGTKEERAKLLRTDADVLITSYPLLRREILWFEKQFFHTVIFDEAQAFKNPLTQTARAVKKLQARHRFALTGTPVENSSEELWSIFHVVFPELFLGLKDFSRLTSGKIARRIRPFLLRRMKEDVLAELPEKIESRETVELLPEQKKLYTAYLAKLRHDTLKHLDKDTIRKNRIRILAGITRLRQICCHPGLFVDGYKGSSAKFMQLKRIVDEAKFSGRRVLIFSQFTKMLEIIGRELTAKGLSYFYLDGQTPSEERLEICQRFNRGDRDLFLISLKAGGTGLNLMGADTVILYDTWWNPAVEEQAADRAHRIGQTNTVQVIKLIARGTIEEKMNELQDRKRKLIEEIIDSDGAALTEEDIKEILML